MFLVGRGIPDRITSLPQTVLDTPFGQMLKPYLDNALRGITQAPTLEEAVPQIPRGESATPNRLSGSSVNSNGNKFKRSTPAVGVVHKLVELGQLEELLLSAQDSCAVIFFTSATCPPCKLVYPAYDELAAEAGNKAVLIKVDISQAYEIAVKYQVRVTPTFMTFLQGKKENEWSGAHEGRLRGNVRMLIQMAHPPHPHMNLKLPILQQAHRKPIVYTKKPPLDKLIDKLGSLSTDSSILALKDFIIARDISGAADAPLPPLPTIGSLVLKSLKDLEPDHVFPVVDILRLALIDPRVSAYFAEEHSQETVLACFHKTELLGENCPYPLRLVTLQLACNLFTSALFPPKLLAKPALSTPLIQLATSSLLDTSHASIGVAAASLAYNIASFNGRQRLSENKDLLPESAQVELMAGLLEAFHKDIQSKDELRGLLLAVGLLAYAAPKGGELTDLCSALEAKDAVSRVKRLFDELDGLAGEVELVLGS